MAFDMLGGITPLKDDSSGLVLPNHTVLNHWTTSSVRHGVLATSVTTRYKVKAIVVRFAFFDAGNV